MSIIPLADSYKTRDTIEKGLIHVHAPGPLPAREPLSCGAPRATGATESPRTAAKGGNAFDRMNMAP